MNMCDHKPIELKDVQPGDIVHFTRMPCTHPNYYLAITRYGDIQNHQGMKHRGIYFGTIGKERMYWADNNGTTRPWIIEETQAASNTMVLVERLTDGR